MAKRKTKVKYIKTHWNKIIKSDVIDLIESSLQIISCVTKDSPKNLSGKTIKKLIKRGCPSVASFYANLPPPQILKNYLGFVHKETIPPEGQRISYLRNLKNEREEVFKGAIDKRILGNITKNSPDFFLALRALLCYFLCFLNTHKPMYSVLRAAQQGDDKSLFVLVQVDKTIINEVWVKQRIYEASLMNKGTFFLDLGRALQKDPLSKKRKHLRSLVAIAILEEAGILSKITYNQLLDFLIDRNIVSTTMTEPALKMLMKEYKKTMK